MRKMVIANCLRGVRKVVVLAPQSRKLSGHDFGIFFKVLENVKHDIGIPAFSLYVFRAA
jgi:hypothetical protein